MDRSNSVVLGLSGGVDSGVAAKRLIDMGFLVEALFLDIECASNGGEYASAKETARALSISLEVRNIGEKLNTYVKRPFLLDYLRGVTPNPCVRCNPEVKFRELSLFADEKGIYNIATGHYARIVKDNDGKAHLNKAKSARDQSYMLYRLPQEILVRMILPLGDAEGKGEIRTEAERITKELAERPDSMDICFIRDEDYTEYIESAMRKEGLLIPEEGDFTDTQGNILGRHGGIHRYTVGQRRGIGISSSAPLYVSDIDARQNRVVLSDESSLYKSKVLLRDMVWTGGIPPDKGSLYMARVRHSRRFDAVRIGEALDGGQLTLDFVETVRAPCPGQSAVLYDGDEVVGGGIIESVIE